jgi:hypothetical protein
MPDTSICSRREARRIRLDEMTMLRRVLGHLAPPAAAAAAAADDDTARRRNPSCCDEWSGCVPPRAITPADYPTAGEHTDSLTPDEAAHFREHGWLIKRGLIPQDKLLPFVDQVWDAVADAGVDRADPATWIDPAAGDAWPTSVGYHGSNLTYFAPDSRFWHGTMGADPAFLAATSHHPSMMRVVESMLGGPIRMPNRNRGLYAVFPRSNPQLSLSGHVDSQSEELLATTLLGTVGDDDGPFTIWPGTHPSMWQASAEQVNWVPNESFEQRSRRCMASVQPLLFTGHIGDTMFWHSRLLHCSGVNRGTRLRLATIMDFGRPFPCSSGVDWMITLPDDRGITHKIMEGYHSGRGLQGLPADDEERAQRILTGMMCHLLDISMVLRYPGLTENYHVFQSWYSQLCHGAGIITTCLRLTTGTYRPAELMLCLRAGT